MDNTWSRTKRVLKTDSEGCGVLLLVAFIASIGVAVTLLAHLYQASVQSAVYRREGIEVSTWEVFVGAKPAERTINVKEQK